MAESESVVSELGGGMAGTELVGGVAEDAGGVAKAVGGVAEPAEGVTRPALVGCVSIPELEGGVATASDCA